MTVLYQLAVVGGAFFAMAILVLVLHEIGHYWTARAFGVKVLEFGFGHPPCAFRIYTGRTTTIINEHTVYLNLPPDSIQPGQVVRVFSGENRSGQLTARYITTVPQRQWRRFRRRPTPAPAPPATPEAPTPAYLCHEGKVREAHPDRLVLADLIYSVNWLPLGGFVRLSGENNPALPRALARQSYLKRSVVLVSGSVMNLLFPAAAFTIIAMLPPTGAVTITYVAAGSPAAQAGLRHGDSIIAVNERPLTEIATLPRLVRAAAGRETQFTIVNPEGVTRNQTMVPRVNPPPEEGPLGIVHLPAHRDVAPRLHSPWQAARTGITDTAQSLIFISQELYHWVASGAITRPLSGPLKAPPIANDLSHLRSFQGWLAITIFLSLNMAIINLLPIPFLDGGRLLFVLLEVVRGGRRIAPEKENVVHLFGYFIISGAVVAICAKDLIRLIN